MYSVTKCCISKSKYSELYDYFDNYSKLSKLLYNAGLFRMRENFTAYCKQHPKADEDGKMPETKPLLEHEQQVQDEIALTIEKHPKFVKPKLMLSYNFLDKLMRTTGNPDFFSGLPMQSSQQVLNDVCRNFKGWLSALKAYGKNPSVFTGKPQMPKYMKSGYRMVKFTNQDCKLKDGMLKLPYTKLTVPFPNVPSDNKLKEVQVLPYYGNYQIIVIYQTNKKSTVHSDDEERPYICGIDFGIDNLATIASNDGYGLLCKGGVVKARNQWFNKRKADLCSILDKQKYKKDTKLLQSISANREKFIDNYMHLVSKQIIDYCIEHKVGTIVIGKNDYWKQNIDIGKQNNQSFCQIPFLKLQHMIEYKAERNGISVILQEESYTSKASFVDNDTIPVYNGNNKNDDDEITFSGKRIKRGLYRSKNGIVINADINGACNIIRKAFSTAFDDIKNDTDWLSKNITVYNPYQRKAKVSR